MSPVVDLDAAPRHAHIPKTDRPLEEKRVGNVERPGNQNADRYCLQQRSLFVSKQPCSTAHRTSIPHLPRPVGTAYHHKGKDLMRSGEELVLKTHMGVGEVEARDGIEPPNKALQAFPFSFWVPRHFETTD
jgi:hypothetical protein